MNPTVTASLAAQRHAELVNQAADHRRAAAARLPRPRRRLAPAQHRARSYRRPLNAFNAWLAAGQL